MPTASGSNYRNDSEAATYKNLGGNSGVESYQIQTDRIIVTFTTGAVYTYSNDSCGADNVEIMKGLARQGQGLNSYIMLNDEVYSGYE